MTIISNNVQVNRSVHNSTLVTMTINNEDCSDDRQVIMNSLKHFCHDC